MFHVHRKQLVVVGATVAVGAAGGTAYATIADGGPQPGQQAVPMTEAVSAAQADNYGVLRRSAAGSLPAAVDGLPAEETQMYGANPALARVAYPRGDRTDAWYVIPGNDSLCFYSIKRSQGGCTALSNANSGGFVVWGVARGPDGRPDTARGAVEAFGVVPDDVTSATAVTADAQVPVAVDGNVLEVAGNGIKSLKFETTSGAPMSATLTP